MQNAFRGQRSDWPALVGALVLLAGLAVVSSPQPAAASSGVLFGTCLRNGLPFDKALTLADQRYGPMSTVRVFYQGAPAAWSGDLGAVRRPMALSFRYSPHDVLTGKADAYMTSWFRTAPRDQTTYWSYSHEPEDQVMRGAFTAADYRAAWGRLAGLAAKAGNPRLVPTLTLMYWTFNPRSGRNWRDYLAGSNVIKVVAVDGYNWGANRSPQIYADPSHIFGGAFQEVKAAGLQVAAGEVGSVLLTNDRDGTGRAKFISRMGTFMRGQHAVFADWYDYDHGGDYYLNDTPSIRAWRGFARA